VAEQPSYSERDAACGLDLLTNGEVTVAQLLSQSGM
jgi:hypothetical protein